jgi:hypothetical protein
VGGSSIMSHLKLGGFRGQASWAHMRHKITMSQARSKSLRH